MRTLVWIRGKDLRLCDHAPLHAALRAGGEVIPLFVLAGAGGHHEFHRSAISALA